MQEYELLLETNLLEGLIESDFEVAVDRFGSLHIIVVTLETLKLLLCLESGSFSVSPVLCVSFSFILCLHLCTPSFCCHPSGECIDTVSLCVPSFPLASDLALATDSLPETTVPLLIPCLVCADRRSAIFYM